MLRVELVGVGYRVGGRLHRVAQDARGIGGRWRVLVISEGSGTGQGHHKARLDH